MLTQQIPDESPLLVYNMSLNHLDDIFDQGMNAKRVLSLAKATLDVIESGSLAIHAMGEGLSLTYGLHRKLAIKQVDRLLNLLGKARDSDGLERTIKADTSMSHGYSFFRQGVIYYSLLIKMKEEETCLLINNSVCYLKQHRLYTSTPRIILDLKMRGYLWY